MRELDDAACLIPGCKRCLGHGVTGVTSGSALVVGRQGILRGLQEWPKSKCASVADYTL